MGLVLNFKYPSLDQDVQHTGKTSLTVRMRDVEDQRR